MYGSMENKDAVTHEHLEESDVSLSDDTFGDIPRHRRDTYTADFTFLDSDKTNASTTSRKRFPTFNDLRSASLTISMFAKPSDDRRANVWLAGWNVSNLIQGTGILGVPYAVQQGGWAAVVMIFFVALLCCHTGKLLIECMYETSRKTGIRRRLRVNYPEVAEACLGANGYVLIAVIQSIEMFSGVIMYIILLGTAWSDLFYMYPQLGLKEWAAINCVVALPSLFITKMSIVSWFSMISVFSLMSAILVLITFSLSQVPLWSISNMPAFDVQTFPIGFGIIVFSYTAHAVFPSIEGAMKEPRLFDRMMNCSFILAALVKSCLGTFMVLRFGSRTNQVATVNLAGSMVFSTLSTALVISNVILALPLTMFVVTYTADDAFLQHFPHLKHWVWLLITRPLAITLALFIGIMIPFFGLIMAVVGSFTGTCLCFIFPCIFHLKLRWRKLNKWEVCVDIGIIIFGAVAGISGVIFSMKALVLAFLQ